MKLSSYAILMMISISLLLAGGVSFYFENKIAAFNQSKVKGQEKITALIGRLQEGEAFISNEKLVAYFIAKKKVDNNTSVFYEKLGEIWRALGFLLVIVAVSQGIILVMEYIRGRRVQ